MPQPSPCAFPTARASSPRHARAEPDRVDSDRIGSGSATVLVCDRVPRGAAVEVSSMTAAWVRPSRSAQSQSSRIVEIHRTANSSSVCARGAVGRSEQGGRCRRDDRGVLLRDHTDVMVSEPLPDDGEGVREFEAHVHVRGRHPAATRECSTPTWPRPSCRTFGSTICGTCTRLCSSMAASRSPSEQASRTLDDRRHGRPVRPPSAGRETRCGAGCVVDVGPAGGHWPQSGHTIVRKAPRALRSGMLKGPFAQCWRGSGE